MTGFAAARQPTFAGAVFEEGQFPWSDRSTHVCALTTVRAVQTRPTRYYVLYAHAATGLRPFLPLLQFFLDRGVANRLPWQRAHARSAQLLLDHLASRGEDVGTAPTGALQRWVDDLLAGTLDKDGNDPTGLQWEPRSAAVVEAHLARITNFADWLAERTGSNPMNPWRSAQPEERLLLMRRFERKAAHALLAHAAYRRHERTAMDAVRTVRAPPRGGGFSDIKAFPEEAFLRLLRHGWSRRASPRAALACRFRLRDLMLTVLLHGGGLRVSEPFHLFVGDVAEDSDKPGSALVWLFHPEHGEAPVDDGGPWRDRAHYLLERWNARPRNLEANGFAAGWKNLAFTDSRRKASRVYWFPTHWGELFWSLYRAYLRHRPSAPHPWLFVSERGSDRGKPYTIAAFEQAHARAVRRAGLFQGKHHGTSPHGHRHAYGLALANAKVDRRVVQRALHHRSHSSQDVYTAAQASDVARILATASRQVFELPDDLVRELVQ